MNAAQEALIHTMVLTAAANGEVNDAEFAAMGRFVSSAAAFRGFHPKDLPEACNDCVAILNQDEGLERLLDRIKTDLPTKLRETAYYLACETAASDGALHDEEIRLLEMVRHRLNIDRLNAAAIERAVRAHHMSL